MAKLAKQNCILDYQFACIMKYIFYTNIEFRIRNTKCLGQKLGVTRVCQVDEKILFKMAKIWIIDCSLEHESNWIHLCISFQVTNFVVFICVVVSEVSHISSAKWANIVSWFGILITAHLLFFHLFRITEVYNSIPWWKIELVSAALWAFFYLTASIDLAIKANNYEALGSSKVWYFRGHRIQN